MKRDEALIEKIPVDQRWYDGGGADEKPCWVELAPAAQLVWGHWIVRGPAALGAS